MKYLHQFSIILLVSFLGEIAHSLLPLPIPASVYGLMMMFFALCMGMIKLDQVKEAASFLIEIMPVMFLPAAAGLLDSWSILKPVCLPILVITIITTIAVMAVSGRMTQFLIRKEKM